MPFLTMQINIIINQHRLLAVNTCPLSEVKFRMQYFIRSTYLWTAVQITNTTKIQRIVGLDTHV